MGTPPPCVPTALIVLLLMRHPGGRTPQPPGPLKPQGRRDMGIVTPENRERNSQILQHYSRGLSYDAIAARMGISRNAVSGVVNRAGVKNRGGRKLPLEDLTGRIFGHWRVIRREKITYYDSRHTYLCQCSCGTQRYICGSNLRRSRSKSCGCGVVPQGRPRKAA